MGDAVKNFLICATPRTGSSFLCYLLKHTRVAGMRTRGFSTAQEFLLKPCIDKRRLVFSSPEDLRMFFMRFLDVSRTQNGVGGFKVMWEQLDYVYAQARGVINGGRGSACDLHQFFPQGTRYIWLVRQDELRQAVSWAKAVQTDVWHDHQRSRYQGRCRFDFYKIRNLLWMIQERNRHWVRFFDANRISPLIVTYEMMARDWKKTVQIVLDYLGVDVPKAFGFENEYFYPQSDRVNGWWLARFRCYQGILTLGRNLGLSKNRI